jgi:hypothetical protein
MDDSHRPPQDHNGHTVHDPHPTIQWRIRVARNAIPRLLDEIETHPKRRGLEIMQARKISAHVGQIIATGARLSELDEVGRQLEDARTELETLLARLTVHGSKPPPAESATTGLPEVVHQVLAARDTLPAVIGPARWLPGNAANRRRVRAWARAWKLATTKPVNLPEVQRAWDAYLRTLPEQENQ